MKTGSKAWNRKNSRLKLLLQPLPELLSEAIRNLMIVRATCRGQLGYIISLRNDWVAVVFVLWAPSERPTIIGDQNQPVDQNSYNIIILSMLYSHEYGTYEFINPSIAGFISSRGRHKQKSFELRKLLWNCNSNGFAKLKNRKGENKIGFLAIVTPLIILTLATVRYGEMPFVGK